MNTCTFFVVYYEAHLALAARVLHEQNLSRVTTKPT
jgi:hypothetical protein